MPYITSSDSLQAAYDALPPYGGTIELEAPGRYHVGSGLKLDRTKPAVFKSTRPARSRRSDANAVIYSDDPLRVTFAQPDWHHNAYGFEFSGVHFEVGAETTIFNAAAVNMMRVVNCGFAHAMGDTTQAPFRVVEALPAGTLGDDNSWWRIRDNYVRGGTLLYADNPNVNQWVVSENVVFPGNSTDPMIWFKRAHRCVIRDNNLEGGAAECGVKLSDRCRGMLLEGNGGERTDPFIVVDDSHANTIIPIGNSTQGATHTLVRFLNNAADNHVFSSVATKLADLPYGHDKWIDDQTEHKLNWVWGSSGNVTAANIHKQRTLGLDEGAWPPPAQPGVARIYEEGGNLKVILGDGTVKVLT